MKIKQAKEKDDFLKCWGVVHELRPHLDQERYLTLILYMIDEGYKMIYIEESGKAVSFLATGRPPCFIGAEAFTSTTSVLCLKPAEKAMQKLCWILF